MVRRSVHHTRRSALAENHIRIFAARRASGRAIAQLKKPMPTIKSPNRTPGVIGSPLQGRDSAVRLGDLDVVPVIGADLKECCASDHVPVCHEDMIRDGKAGPLETCPHPTLRTRNAARS